MQKRLWWDAGQIETKYFYTHAQQARALLAGQSLCLMRFIKRLDPEGVIGCGGGGPQPWPCQSMTLDAIIAVVAAHLKDGTSVVGSTMVGSTAESAAVRRAGTGGTGTPGA